MTVNVFLSFSGDVSEAVARALHEWLPSVIQSVDPFLSSKSLDSGSRWSSEIATKLEDCGIGILCLTPENLEAPWILFEAGALGKILEQSKVIPYLIGVERVKVRQPLSQFQSEVANKSDTLKLVKTINGYCGTPIAEQRLETTFEKWWPELENKITQAQGGLNRPANNRVSAPEPSESTSSVLSAVGELIQTVQGLQSIIGNPEKLFPPEYLRFVMHDFKSSSSENEDMKERVHADILSAREKISSLRREIEGGIDVVDMDNRLRSVQVRLSMARDRLTGRRFSRTRQNALLNTPSEIQSNINSTAISAD